jgi:hypothetical protein
MNLLPIKRIGLTIALLTGSWTLYAMGHKMAKDDQDTTFDAHAEKDKNAHETEVTTEQKPVGLPATPSDVEKDTAKDFNDPFFKEKEKDPNLETDKTEVSK